MLGKKKYDSVLEAIVYILNTAKNQEKSLNVLKLTKLLYLSDKYNLIHTGKKITNDIYIATVFGPTGKIALDILGGQPLALPAYYQEKVKKYIGRQINYFQINCAVENKDLRLLTLSDKQSIDFVLNQFNGLDTLDLIRYIKRYPEFTKFLQTKKQVIKDQELFSSFAGDLLLSNLEQKVLPIAHA